MTTFRLGMLGMLFAFLAPLTTQAQVVAQADCNECHFCADQVRKFISASGVSTAGVEAAPTTQCRPNCDDHGPLCDPMPFHGHEEVLHAVSEGESPSVAQLVAEHREHLRYIPSRNMLVVLGNCGDLETWALAFPVRSEESALVRRSVELLTAD